MRIRTVLAAFSLLWFVSIDLAAQVPPLNSGTVRNSPPMRFADLNPAPLAPFPLFDAHCHYAGEHPLVLKWMAANRIKLMNIAVGRTDRDWRAYADLFGRLAAEHPDRFAWCTSITPPDFMTPAYSQRVIRQLETDFANAAVACKIGKNIGMRVQKPDGQYVQIDDPIFTPVFAWLASNGHTLVAHIAEPIACWQPLDANNPYRHYYSKHPEWHMHGRTDRPDHATMVAARDRVIERHPTLRVIGAHLGSLEYDVAELAKRFDKYPNFAVDTSGRARIGDLGRQERDKVREFFIRYQDRIMFGSDRSARGQLAMKPDQLEESLKKLTDALELGWAYYATDKVVTVNGQACHGVALPQDVLLKIFSTNAEQWFPRLAPTAQDERSDD